MATVAATILKDDQKLDGTWNVKIRISHKGKSRYIETKHFVNKKQLDKNFKIKDPFIIDRIAEQLKTLRDKISNIPYADNMDVLQIRDRLADKNESIDFSKFSHKFIKEKTKAGKVGSISGLVTVVNSLEDFFKSKSIPVSEITSNFLVKYEGYLRSKRKIKRNKVNYTKQGLSDAGLHNHMRDLRLLFNAARNEFNDEDKGIVRIAHYPFKKYKVGQAPLTEKRNRTIDEIIKIRDCVVSPGGRAELARDLFMLSFYLCGMNAADIYELPAEVKLRLNYNRCKTRDRRRDKAFMSVAIPDEAKGLLEKYAGKLKKRYSAISGLNTALNKGLAIVATSSGVAGIDFYDARHSFGNIARNVCRFSKDDVALALNHTDRVHSVTDTYISVDWSIVDEVQIKVLGLL